MSIVVTKSFIDSFDIVDRKKITENFEILSVNEKNSIFNIKNIKCMKFQEKSQAMECIKEVILFILFFSL